MWSRVLTRVLKRLQGSLLAQKMLQASLKISLLLDASDRSLADVPVPRASVVRNQARTNAASALSQAHDDTQKQQR